MGFFCIAATRDEIAVNVEAWRDEIERITGVAIYDLHVIDIMNVTHPSNFESTNDYEMVVFQKLEMSTQTSSDDNVIAADTLKKIPSVLSKLLTQPVSFVVMDRVVITVHAPGSKTIQAARIKLLEHRGKGNNNGRQGRKRPSKASCMT